MIFWTSILVLIAIAILFVLWPLMAGGRGRDRLAHAVAFYESRKAELIRQREAGEISVAECEAAIAEQARNLIALGRVEKPGPQTDAPSLVRRRKFAALIMLAGIPAFSMAVYFRVGAPSAPDVPLASRQVAPQNFDVATALQKIEAHLAKNPNDGRGYEVVAPVYIKAGRFSDAAHAFRRVVELLGENPERLADLGESLVATENGVVGADARQAFERSVKLDPDFAKSRFYLALAREQDGDVAGALAELQKIMAGLPEGPSRMRVGAEIERFRAGGKVASNGPQGEAGRAIASLPEADREGAIKGMVDALEARLLDKGGSIEDWRRLIQSRIVLDQREQAEAILLKARAAFSSDPVALAALDTLAAGLKSAPATRTP